MNGPEILKLRLANQRLVAPKFKEPAEVVSWLGAIQSQDYDGGKWSIGLRLPGITEGEVERAFRDGDIVRTHILRPTWHFVAPADIRWMLELTGPRIRSALASYVRKIGVDDALFMRGDKLITNALRDGEALTRAELKAALTQGGIPTDHMRLAFLVMHAETGGLICSGPRRGKQFTYMLLDKRVSKAKKLTREEALAELTRRYFTSHGPATAHDFGWWSGLTMKDVRAGLAMNTQLEHDEQSKTWLPKTSKVALAPSPHAQMLQVYDEYLVSYKDRSAAMDPQSVSMGNFLFAAPLILDGRVVGSWKRELHGRVRRVEFKYLRPISGAEQKAIDAAAECYGDYLCTPLVVSGR